MSIAAEKIPKDAFNDMLAIFDIQPWTKESADELIQLWNLCETREEQELLRELLQRFTWFDSVHENKAMTGINQVVQKWGLKPKSTWVVAVANTDEIDGSSAGLQKLKNKIEPFDNWHARFVSNIPSAASKIQNGDSVLLFDDFIGTGNKMLKKAEWLKRLCEKNNTSELKIYYISFSGMDFGLKHLDAQAPNNVYSYLRLKKGISENYPADLSEHYADVMRRIESRLGVKYNNKKLKDYSLGYKNSEALFCAQNDNCPNNVFPVLWWPILENGSRQSTLLKRAG